MDFIERLFGFSPDNGDGSTEIFWLAVLASVLVVGIAIVRRRRKPHRIFTHKRR